MYVQAYIQIKGWGFTHQLCYELSRFGSGGHRQKSQTKLQNHKLLQSAEVLLTQVSLLHDHNTLQTAVRLQQQRQFGFIRP